MERERRRTTHTGHTTEQVINNLRETFGVVNVENSEFSNDVNITFKVEENFREPESRVVFTERDKFVEMRFYLPVHNDEEEAQEVVEEVVDFIEAHEDMPDCITVRLDSDQGGQVFRPVLEISNETWVQSDYQIDTIQNFFAVFLGDYFQEEDS